MTEEMRAQVRAELERQGISQVEAANRMGLSPQYVWDMLSGRASHMPKRWQQLLDLLNLEVVVRSRAPRSAAKASEPGEKN